MVDRTKVGWLIEWKGGKVTAKGKFRQEKNDSKDKTVTVYLDKDRREREREQD